MGVQIVIALQFAVIFWAGVEALRDKSPRQPFQWKRPELAWWAGRRTARERLTGYIRVGKKVG